MYLIRLFLKISFVIYGLNYLIKKNKDFNMKLMNKCIVNLLTHNNQYVVFYTRETLFYINHIYSVSQIFYYNNLIPKINFIKKNTTQILQKYKLIDNTAIYNVKMYDNNKLSVNIPVYDMNELTNIFKELYKSESTESTENKLMILTDYCNNDNKSTTNMICYYDKPISFDYEKSSIKFISMSVTYENETYDIELLNNKRNFYIVGNKINKLFIHYYLEHELKIDININNYDNFEYILSFYDDNADFKSVTQDTVIVINKENYNLVLLNVSEDNLADEYVVT